MKNNQNKHQLLLADPPWQYSNKASNGAAENHYPTMTLADMMTLPVANIAADDAVLCMWYTGNFVAEAMSLAKAWGFKVKTMKGLTWVKLNQLAEQHINKEIAAGGVTDYAGFMALLNEQTRMNGGNYTRANSEDMLIAVRGNGLERQSASIKQVIYAPIGRHSAKPAEQYDKLEALYGDVSRVELFARHERAGWSCIGNGIDGADIRDVLLANK